VHLDTVPDFRLPLPVTKERGEGWGGDIEKKRASSPQPSPPADGGEGVRHAAFENSVKMHPCFCSLGFYTRRFQWNKRLRSPSPQPSPPGEGAHRHVAGQFLNPHGRRRFGVISCEMHDHPAHRLAQNAANDSPSPVRLRLRLWRDRVEA
jgi:hypothetical protein